MIREDEINFNGSDNYLSIPLTENVFSAHFSSFDGEVVNLNYVAFDRPLTAIEIACLYESLGNFEKFTKKYPELASSCVSWTEEEPKE